MSPTSKHIIKQQVLDITVTDQEHQEEVTDALPEIYKSHIEGIFDEVCENLIPPNEVLRFSSLTLDIGHLEFEKLATEFPKAVKNAVREALYQHIRDKKVSPVRFGKAAIQNKEMALAVYLKTGLLPWYYEGTFEKLRLEFSSKKIKSAPELINSFRNPDSRKRAVHFFEESVLLAFLRDTLSIEERTVLKQFELLKSCLGKCYTIHKDRKNGSIPLTVNRLLKEMVPKGETYSFVMEQFLKQLSGESNKVMEELAQMLPREYRKKLHLVLHAIAWKKEAIFSKEEATLLKSLEALYETMPYEEIHFETRKNEFELDTKFIIEERLDVEQGGIGIPNAGLILIWPYLEAFFSGLGLMKEGSFITQESATKAIHLLHYLVFKTEEGDETEWLLNKILCGIEPTTFISEHFDLSSVEKDECDHLLHALIGNWQALKSTGPDSLRQTFLQRRGLLVEDENGWLLKVERRAFDVLLDRLTWAISVVKMPWNEFLIHTEW